MKRGKGRERDERKGKEANRGAERCKEGKGEEGKMRKGKGLERRGRKNKKGDGRDVERRREGKGRRRETDGHFFP